MPVARRDSAKTKDKILRAARKLFAERDITSVGIREIATAAGVSHGLVQRYFGTREQMVAEIVRQEVQRFSAAPPLPTGTSPDDLATLREALKAGFPRFVEYSRVIMRAELDGIAPETMLEHGRPTPAMQLTEAIRKLQGRAPRGDRAMDPAIVSAYINASLFAFGTMGPWLMVSVGLDPRDYESRLDEIVDISVRLIVLAAGPGNEAPWPNRSRTHKRGRATLARA